MNHGYIFDCYGTLVHPISNTGAKEFLQTIKPEEIIPNPLDKNVATIVAEAVKKVG